MASQEILPLDPGDKDYLVDIARHLAPLREHLIEGWAQLYLSSAIRLSFLSEQTVLELIRKPVDLLVNEIPHGRFDEYFEGMASLGRHYADQNLPYHNMVLAIHLYEDIIVPIILKINRDADELQAALRALDHLFHNALAVAAAAYYQGLLTELEAARQRHQQLSSMVIHELRNPLTVIAGYAQVLAVAERGGPSSPPRAIAALGSQVQRLQQLVADLADTAAIEAGHFELHRSVSDLRAVVREVVEQQRVTTSRHRLHLTAPQQPVLADLDATRIAQVLGNLIANAVKYTPEGDIRICVERHGDEALVSVADEGPGIAAEDLPYLFRPFSRLPTTRGSAGQGLGLFIAKSIVEAHGGHVWAESGGEGRGATFSFTVPIVA